MRLKDMIGPDVPIVGQPFTLEKYLVVCVVRCVPCGEVLLLGAASAVCPKCLTLVAWTGFTYQNHPLDLAQLGLSFTSAPPKTD